MTKGLAREATPIKDFNALNCKKKKSFPTILSALADTGSSDGLLSGLLPGGGGLLGGLGSGGLLGGLLPGSSDDSSRYLVEHLEFSYPVNQIYCTQQYTR